MHGFSTIYLVFGPEDAERLLGIDNAVGINSKWALGLPLIPLALIAARTRYADNLLPILPIFYFASTGPQRNGPLWPPSASMTVAILPYIRAAYNEFYDRVCAPKEKAWIKQIQPRAGDNEGDGQHDQNQAQRNEFEDGMDIGLDLQVDMKMGSQQGKSKAKPTKVETKCKIIIRTTISLWEGTRHKSQIYISIYPNTDIDINTNTNTTIRTASRVSFSTFSLCLKPSWVL